MLCRALFLNHISCHVIFPTSCVNKSEVSRTAHWCVLHGPPWHVSLASAATDSVIDHWISPSGSRPAAELYLIGCWFLNYPRGGFGGRIWVSFSILSATHLRVFMLTIKTKLFYFNNKECFCSAVEPMSVGADWNCPLVQIQVWIFVSVHCGFT